MESAGEVEVEAALDDPRNAALAGLGVDADDGFVGAANVCGVEGEVWELPWAFVTAARVFTDFEALLNRILMGPGESADDELAAVGRTWVDGDLGTVFNGVNDRGDVREVDVRVDALGVEVECECDEVNIAGAFAVAEEAAFDTVGAGHLGEFSGRNGAAAVVVRVQGDADFLALRDVPSEVLNLVGVDVGGGHFDGCREVEDDGVGFGGLPCGLDGLTDADGEVEAGIGEGLWREFVSPLGPLCLRVILGEETDELGAVHCECKGLLLTHSEDDPTEAFGSCEVEVDDGLLRALQGLDGAPDEILPTRGEDLDPHVIRNRARSLDQSPGEVKVGLRGRRERDLDFLVADANEHLEHAPFLVAVL